MRILLTQEKYWLTIMTIVVITAIIWTFIYNLFLDPPYKTNRERRAAEGKATMIVLTGIIIPIGITFAVLKEKKK